VSSEQILSQAEIDAIVNGVDSGAVSTEPVARPGETRPYDFNSQSRIVRGRMPTLEMINERFARLLRIGLYTLLKRSPEVSVSPIKIKKFSDYMYSLQLPTNLNMVRIRPWRGMALIVLDPKLVFAVVDQFFGGTGRHAKIEGREFTATEYRIIQMVLQGVFANMHEAWSHIAAIEVEYVKAEINPHFASIVSPSEIVVITSFQIELDGAGGELHITMPYAMIEPLREVLDSGMASDQMDKDERWPLCLREEIEYAEVELTTVLTYASITVAGLLNLKVGDILPCDFSGHVVVRAEDVPVFRGSFGVSGGQQAVKIEERILERKSRQPPKAS
jgi:flagellar motor switch protein FliM